MRGYVSGALLLISSFLYRVYARDACMHKVPSQKRRIKQSNKMNATCAGVCALGLNEMI